jgi:hypothetical protein
MTKAKINFMASSFFELKVDACVTVPPRLSAPAALAGCAASRNTSPVQASLPEKNVWTLLPGVRR